MDVPVKWQHTTTHIIKAISTLERWWWAKFGEERPIENMDPVDLNRYLEQFFPILRRPSGEEYNKDSLTNFRSYLDRFLREKGYPYSISKSVEFASSQLAFTSKRQWLAAHGK